MHNHYPKCKHRTPNNECIIASKLALLPCVPRIIQCQACTQHPTPQRINGIVCAVAFEAQKTQGLIPDNKLLECIKTNETLPEETLKFLRNKWRELHTLTCRPWDPVKVKEMYEEWKKDLPVFGCDCKQHWDIITQKHPIDFMSSLTYFRSTWVAHNEVNKKLFKPVLGFKEAYHEHMQTSW